MNKFFALVALAALVAPPVKADAVLEIDTQVSIINKHHLNINIFVCELTTFLFPNSRWR